MPAVKPVRTRRVIIVDDIPDQLELFKTHLEVNGFEVCLASSGRELINCLLDGEWDAILMDVNLPGEMGTHLAERVRREHPTVPIAYLTAYVQAPTLMKIAERQGIPVLDRFEMAQSGKLVEFLDKFAYAA